MTTLTIKEARACLSSLVDRVERGEMVVITRHGRKAACLGPVVLGLKSLPSLGDFRAGIVKSGKGLVDAVLASRREGRF